MKKYILTGMALLVVSATSSENPFDLKENFGQLEQDQELLLVELKKIADLKELAEEKKLAEEEAREVVNSVVETELPREDLPTSEIENIITSPDAKVDNLSKQAEGESKQAVMPKEVVVPSEENLNTMRQKALDANRTEAIKKETLDKEALEKEALEQAIKSRESELKKAKEEAEKREVEAYEKKRAERLARKAAEAAALEKEVLVQKEAKEIASSKVSTAPTVKKQTAVAVKKAKIDMEQSTDEEKSIDNNIDVAREKEDAKIAADKAYEEAVKGMSQEEIISSPQATKVKDIASSKVSTEPTVKKQTPVVARKAKIDTAKSTDEEKSTVNDVDVAREKEDAKIAADKAYEEAIKEMSQEETISSS